MEHLSATSLFGMKGKVALITGGSRGIGLMIAQGFVANGATVYIASRKAEVCDEVAKQLTAAGPGHCISLPADLSSDDACKDLVARLSAHESKLDVLVNCAGATWGAPMMEFPEKAWDKVMRLNVYSIFWLTRACVSLLEAGSNGSMDPSHVINIGSVAGTVVFEHDDDPSYVASKAAVNQLTKYFANKLVSSSVNVNCIAPAVFPSNMTKNYSLSDAMAETTAAMHPVGRVGSTEDMAGLALFLGTKASAFVTGSTIHLDGGVVDVRRSAL